MKKVYKALALVAGLFVGSMAGNAQHWKYEDQARVDAESIQPGTDYALLPASAANAGTFNFLAGEKFTTSLNLVEANLYQFEDAGTSAQGERMFYLKRKTGEYVAVPTNGQFYTTQLDRAWKLVVKAISHGDANHQWPHTERVGEGETAHDTIINYTGINAYLWEAHDNPDSHGYDFSSLSFTVSDNAVVMVDPVAVEATSYNYHNFFMTYPGTTVTGAPGKGSDYSRNSWVIYQALPMTAFEGLEAVLQELFKNENLEDRLANYRKGDNAGEYNEAKYNILLDLWKRAKAIVEANGDGATDAEMQQISKDLPVAYEAFITSGKPLTAGYYVVYSMRPNGQIFPAGHPTYPYGRNGNPTPEDYDDGAIYDGSAVNATDNNLRWSYMKNDAVKFTRDEIDSKNFTGEHAKFVWKVTDSGTKDNAGNPLYYFQNIETNKYIGKDPKTYSPIVMTAKPEVAYTIAASKEFPGYFNFYSPALTKATEQGATTAEYSGMHASSDVNNVVAWDWRVGGSCWQVIALTQAEVDKMIELAAPAKRLATLEALVKKSEDAIAAGKVYMGTDAAGVKVEHAASGSLGDHVDGFVTTKEQLFSPMFDSAEGQNIGDLVDGNLGTYFHSTWHGGTEAWTKNHFLQMQLSQPEKEILIKWVKRDGTNNNGAPLKVAIWGAKDETQTTLEAGKTVTDNEDGTTTTNFDAWKEKWDSLTVGNFSYPYEVTWTDGTTKKANAAGTARFVLPNEYKYIRMEVLTRVADGDKPAGNKYFHAAEVRVYRAAYDKAASIYEAVPADIRTALDAAVVAAKAKVEGQVVSDEDVAALQTAYDNFMNNYPDPAKVTKAITAAETLVGAAVEGDQLGYYAAGSKDAATAVINSVKAQLDKILNIDKRQPTVEEVNKLLAELNAGMADFKSKLQVPASGIYAIKSFTSNETVVNRRIMAPNSSRKSYMKMVGRKQVNGAWSNDDEVAEKLGTYWQVTKVDGGYTYKNLFTGLYLAPNTEDKGARMVTQSETEYVFALEFAKVAGAFNIVAKKADVLNEEHVFLNAQPGGNYDLVLWNAASGRDNSAFTFEKVEQQVTDLLTDGFVYDVPFPGKAQIMTFPIAIEKQDGFYTVLGQDAQNNIQLKKVTENLVAGQAYVYKPTTADKTVILIPVAKAIADLAPIHKEAEAVNGLVATFETIKVQEQNGIFNPDHTKVLLSEANESVAANTGYFTKMPVATAAGDTFIEANGNVTSINGLVVLDKTAKEGVYTLSGVRVKNVKSLPAGLYIVNGQKVLVK